MIDPKQIPEKSLMDIVAATHGALQEFYADPENQRAFEKWKAERRKTKDV